MHAQLFPYPTRFTDADLRLMAPEDLASRLQVSRAFVRLCVVTGCPTREEKLTSAGLLLWLFDHYEAVREAAGLKPLASVDGLEPHTVVRLRMANALFTLLDYSRSRATNWRHKKALRIAAEKAERSLEQNR